MYNLKHELAYTKLSTANLESASNCVCKTFAYNEPLARHLEMTEEDLKPFFHPLLVHSLEDDLSWVASIKETGEVIGASICTDCANDFYPERSFTPKLEYTLKLFDDLWRPFIQETHLYPKGYLAHGYVAAVLPEYQRLGILTQLYQVSFAHGWKKGYRKVMGEITSQYSLNFMRKIPILKECHAISYADYEVDGKKVFSGMDTHEKCILFSLSFENENQSQLRTTQMVNSL